MKVAEAIHKIDALKPNSYTLEDKVAWLSTLDGMVSRQIITTHELLEDEEALDFEGYTTDDSLDVEMLIYAPYEDAYIYWLESKIDYQNGEIEKYNNSALRFNDMYTEFSNDYNRHHMPKGEKIKYF